MSLTIDKEVDSDLNALPAGPWNNEGPWIMAGDQPVGVVSEIEGRRTAQQASELARLLAKLPDYLRILRVANPDVMQARIEELEQENKELREELSVAESSCLCCG